MNLEKGLRILIEQNQIPLIVETIKNQNGQIDDKFLDLIKTEGSPFFLIELLLNEIEDKDYNSELIRTIAVTLEEVALDNETDKELRNNISSVFIEALYTPDIDKGASRKKQLLSIFQEQDSEFIGKKISMKLAKEKGFIKIEEDLIEYLIPDNSFWTYTGDWDGFSFKIRTDNKIIHEIHKIGNIASSHYPGYSEELFGFPNRLNIIFRKIMNQIII
jgi:hypothetical protein